MNHPFKRISSLVLVLSMVFSMLCVGVSATEVTSIPHLEVGAVSGAYEAGDIVEIPVYIKGIEDDQVIAMIDCDISVGTGLELQGSVFPDVLTSNTAYWLSYTDNFAQSGYPHVMICHIYSTLDPSYFDNGDVVFTIQATVTEDITGVTTTGVTLLNVQMCGADKYDLLNIDETGDFVGDAVVYPTDEDGNSYGGVTVLPPAEYKMVASATPDSVVVGEVVTVNIAVNGADFFGFDYYLSWDETQFELKSAPEDASDKGDGLYSHGGATGDYTDGQTIATYTFTTMALAKGVEEATFNLTSTHVAEDALAGTSSAAAEEVTNTDATVAIEMDTMTATGDTNTETYTGADFTVNAPETSETDVTIKYSAEDDSTYDLDAAPGYSAADTYTTYWEVSKLGFESVTGSSKLVIGTATLENYAVTVTPTTPYTGSDIVSAEVTVGTPEGATVTFTYGDGETSITPPSFSTVGSHEVSYEITLDNYTTVEGEYTFVIYNGTIDAAGANKEVTYNGYGQTIDNVIVDYPDDEDITVSVTYSDAKDGTYSEEQPTFTNVGTHTVYWKVEAVGFTTLESSNTVTIKAAEVTITVADAEKTYGEANPVFGYTSVTGLAETDTEEDLNIKYSCSADEDSNIGGYAISATIDNGNYTVTTVNEGTLTIKAKVVNVTVNNTTATYGQAIPDFSVSNTEELGTITYTCDATVGSAAADYTIGVSAISNTNYELGTVDEGTLTINPAEVTVSVGAYTKVYGEEDPTIKPTITGLYGEDELTISYDREVNENVGTYDITATVTANDNYTVTSNTAGSLEITQAPLTITVDEKTIVYGEDLPNYTGDVDGLVNGDTETSLGITYSSTATATSPVDTYPITATIANDDNYEVTNTPSTLTITDATITVTSADYSEVYNDAPYTFTVTADVTDATIEYSTDNGATYSTTAPVFNGVTETTTVLWQVSKDNYTTETGSNTVTITAASLGDVTVEGTTGATYTGSDILSANPTLSAGQSITYTYGDDTTDTAPEFTDADTYTVSYTISKANYADVTGSYTFTIAPADVTITAVDASKTYGDAEPESFTYEVTDGTVITGDDLGVTVSRATGEDAGTYAITISEATNGNYAVTPVAGTFTINPKAITATIEAIANVTYDGTAKTPTLVVKDGTTEIATDEYTVTYANNTDAGTATATLVDVDGGNYTVSGSATFTIDPLTVNVTVKDATKIYGDGNPEFFVSNEEDLGTITYTCTADSTSTVDDTYDIGVDAISNGNYALGTVTAGTLSITTRAVTIAVSDASKLFGEDDPAFTSSTDNVVNGDDLGIGYSRVEGETAGSYEITVASITNTNYTFTVSKTGTLTIGAPEYEVEVSANEYIPGYNLVMVYTETAGLLFSYGDLEMYDLSAAGYTTAAGETYTHVYGVLVDESLDETKVSYTSGTATAIAYDGYDVNASNSVDLYDVVAAVAVYNVNETYLESYMEIVFKTDVNRDKAVDTIDASAIKDYYL